MRPMTGVRLVRGGTRGRLEEGVSRSICPYDWRSSGAPLGGKKLIKIMAGEQVVKKKDGCGFGSTL